MQWAYKSTGMQEKVPDTAETEVSIIPEVSVAVPVGAGVKLEDRLRGALRVKGLAKAMRGEIGSPLDDL